jgi:hypothetical protein
VRLEDQQAGDPGVTCSTRSCPEIKRVRSHPAEGPTEAGNSRANTYHRIASLKTLGRVDRSVTADDPLAVALRLADLRTYCVYSLADRPRTVTSSDGSRVEVRGKRFTIITKGK